MNPYGDYPDLAKVKRILVIKLLHLGDVLLTSPVFTALKRYIPHAEIFSYIYKDTLPMLEGHPDIAGFHLYDNEWKRLSFFGRVYKEVQLIREIREKRYDMIINLTEGDRGAFVGLLSNAVYRVGPVPDIDKFGFKKRIFTHVVKRCKRPRHMVEQHLDAVRRIGLFPTTEERDMVLHIPRNARSRIEKYLYDARIAPKSYVLIHPTSRWMFKCWASEKVAELISQLHGRGYKIVLTSGPEKKEMAMIQDIVSLCPAVSLLDLSGALDLKELSALIQMCGCLVTPDSVPAHIASALKVPVAVLFGPSAEEAWGPWNNQGGYVIAENFSCRPCNLDGCGGSKVCDCMERIPVQRVLDTVMTVAGKK